MNLPSGFRYGAVYAGIRKVERNDLALIVSDAAASAAAVFTTNRVQAAPVLVGKAHLEATGGRARAVLVNAGNANCATRTGMKVAEATSRAAARILKVRPEEILPSSTGVIGVELDRTLIEKALPKLAARLSTDAFDEAADAILTTDTVRKTASTCGPGFVVAGMTKGSGMIHPGMATTLAFVMTDAAIAPGALRKHLRVAVEGSYNRLSVDGDMSTNDTLAVLANGASGTDITSRNAAAFQAALDEVCQSLARQIARDGEGASHFVEIEVSGGKNDGEAARVARAIANSPLVKTAIAGADANWGRILCAAGYSGVNFDPGKTSIRLQKTLVCRNGLAARYDEPALIEKLKSRDVSIQVSLGSGNGKATFWTCDLTHGYIDINGSYRT
ncbi:MAG: bifunctional glutamate N-acetyltransferase/amino-acid acetyltransferase ArgJ [Bryobacteraceae bacterium]|nr:bifunctional glutamate N-acetyltransferase/amino-acid acetyltransferase ArgJ [Bryobacteraceae bacterium]